jgi:hypothetical protein
LGLRLLLFPDKSSKNPPEMGNLWGSVKQLQEVATPQGLYFDNVFQAGPV